MLETARLWVLLAHAAVLAGLAAFAAHRLFLVLLLVRHRRPPAPPPLAAGALPAVTVQLPLFDEAAVAARLLETVGRLDYPRELLEVQVLDDSTDETSEIVAAGVAGLEATGLRVRHVRRGGRTGFKAGALAAGLETAHGELVAILDADFEPRPDFLRRVVPHFADPRVGCVQAAWEHANRGRSWLTRVQAILLDGHFLIEQTARSRSGRPFNFNGTAGVWRRTTIEESGGWAWDTLTEDLDLSIRAQLRGWRFVFRDDVSVPGELPEDLAAYRCQQERWVEGSASTARKLLGAVWRSGGFPLRARVETTVQLLLNASYPLVLLLSLLAVPLVGLGPPRRWGHSLAAGHQLAAGLAALDRGLLAASIVSVSLFFLASQARRGVRGLLAALFLLPGVFALGIGLSLSNSRAFVRGLFGRRGPFVRTPKRGALEVPRYVARGPRLAGSLELLLAGWLLAGAELAVRHHRYAALPYLVLLVAGFVVVGAKTLVSHFKSKEGRDEFARSSSNVPGPLRGARPREKPPASVSR